MGSGILSNSVKGVLKIVRFILLLKLEDGNGSEITLKLSYYRVSKKKGDVQMGPQIQGFKQPLF